MINPLGIYNIYRVYTLHIPPTSYPQVVDNFGHITTDAKISWNFSESDRIK
jgi:hypothetical protein